ncbi:toxin Cry1Ac domain D-VI-related protein, partial [Listeria newyorkensis]
MKKQNKMISKVSKVMVAGTIVFSSLGTIPFNTLAAEATGAQATNAQVTIQNGVKVEYTQVIKTNPWQGNLVGTEYVAKTFSEDFGTNEPFLGLGKTNYSITKTAFVVIPVSGQYNFRTQGDDRTTVKINGVQKLATGAYNATDDKNVGYFHGGDIIEVSQTMENDGSIGFMALKWGMPNLILENPDGQRKDIPLSSTFPTREQAEQAAAKMKDYGVLTEYFDGTSSNVFKGQIVEPESFTKHYGSTEPYPGVGTTDYTVKKTGYIYISETGNYRFNGGGDDYYTLTIDGKELIKSLKYPNYAETGNIYLEKGSTIKIEQTFVNEAGEGYSSLRWTTPSQPAYSDVKATDVYESKEKALASNEGTSFADASTAVNNLFTNKDPNGNIKSTLTQDEIDAAQALVNKVTDPTKKAALQADLNKAQAQLDAKTSQTEAENKAREAVNNLFTNKNPNGNITGTMTQADIDAAQALVNKVTDPTKKAALQADLNKAQAQLDAKTSQTEAENKAREAVNNLFTNKNP